MKKNGLDRILFALADPTRRAALDLIASQSYRASELAAELGLSRPAMSRHLRVLREAGLLVDCMDEEDFRATLVALIKEPLTEVRTWLQSLEKAGRVVEPSKARRNW